jgi:DNA-directed RNA polymerase specialized sigma24 family protein
LETRSDIDFGELAVRLASYGLRTFAEFGLGGQNATVPGVGLSVEDFVWNVLSEYAEGALAYEADRGALFSLLARALRNDIIDALRKAAHSREEARSPLPRENKSGNGPPALDELPTLRTDIDTVLAEDSYRARLLAAFADEPELAEVVRVVLELDLAKPREIAQALGISVADYQNRKKRLRRRLIEYHAVEASQV